MIFFDTSVIVHSIVNQNPVRQKVATSLIRSKLQSCTLLISTLVFTELVFVLGKLKLSTNDIANFIKLYQNEDLCKSVPFQTTNQAFLLASKLNAHRHINDAIHLKFAEKYCSKLVTFDADFKKFIPYTSLNIEILT